MKIKGNFRVEVIPYTDWVRIQVSAEPTEDDCKTLLVNIKRHCDINSIDIKHDWICSFCGEKWKMDEEINLPFCCNEAQEEYRKQNCKHEGESKNGICLECGRQS